MNTRRRALWRMLAAGFAAVLPGLARAVPYKFFRPPTKNRIRVQIRFVKTEADAVNGLCRGGGGCWFESATGNDDLIVCPMPKDFNDEHALYILGHEIFHSLGAQHD